jgi:molybdopterin-guanine dinucleotide biosynthesis protein A
VADRDLTGILLVGGASRRFGAPKALARLGEATLAERAWRTLGEVCAERLAVGKTADALDLPFQLVDDGSDVRAPLAGLAAGLRAARHELCVVLPVDCPLVDARLLRELVAACEGDAAVPQTGPLPGVYRRSALPVMERRLAAGELALRGVVAELDATVVDLDHRLLANVNTPADLEAAERRLAALEAATAIGRAHGLDVTAPRILQDWNDTVVHLAPAPVVARVGTSRLDRDREGALAREVAVAAHAVAHGAPVVPPTALAPPGPHRAGDLAVSLWELVEELPGEPTPDEHAVALRALHEALADYRGRLPDLEERLADAQAVADDLPTLPGPDRALLSASLRRLRAEALAGTPLSRVLHGGPHGANLLRTRAGLRWIDFDTACRGPLEWDLAHLPAEALAHFPEADLDRLDTMRRLVSAVVAVWCWRQRGRAPEVDEAAEFHLERVREAAGSTLAGEGQPPHAGDGPAAEREGDERHSEADEEQSSLHDDHATAQARAGHRPRG